MPSPRYKSPSHKPAWYKARQRAITPAQKRALRELWPLYGLAFRHDEPLDVGAAFGPQRAAAPTVLEIGCGTGEALVQLAAARRDANFLGVDWFRSGIASCLQSIEERRLDNVRVVRADAAMMLERGLPAQPTFDEALVFFPDPWIGSPERLMMRPEVMRSLSARMRANGVLHFASDVEGYPARVYAPTPRRTLTGRPRAC
jgi:tRNA (guanine-N7-)-methyltransferase